MNFNKYKVFDDIIYIIQENIDENIEIDLDDIIHNYVSNNVIYTNDCHIIIGELYVTDFKHAVKNGITDISGIAGHYLMEYIHENHYGRLNNIVSSYSDFVKCNDDLTEAIDELKALYAVDGDNDEIEDLKNNIEQLKDDINEIKEILAECGILV